MPVRGVTSELFATAAPGLETIVASELGALGMVAKAETGGAAWTGGPQEIYSANLHLRSASRVLVRIARFRARSFIEMERHARRIDWTPLLSPGTPVRLRVSSRKSRLYHEGAIAERFARYIEESTGAPVIGGRARDQDEDDLESAPETPETGQLFVVRFLRDECVVSADTSGELLHRRGYRQAVARAPIRETLAAAMLLAADWEGDAPLVDPLCGSGTIPIEGALIARCIAPGIANPGLAPRSFAFERWPSFEPEVLSSVVNEARAAVRDRPRAPIRGSDRDPGAIEAARANAARAGLSDDVEFDVRSISAVESPSDSGHGHIVTNPPYGVRVGDPSTLRDLYAALGNLAGDRFPGWSVTLLAAQDGLDRHVGIPFREILHTRNGGIPVRLLTGISRS